MTYTVEICKRTLRRLFPRGRVFEIVPGSRLDKLLEGIAGEFKRIHDRVADLYDEADPRTTTECVGDWEAMLGLPDDPYEDDPSIDSRRETILARLTAKGGQNKAFFAAIAQSMGHADVTVDKIIDHWPPLVAGSPAGAGCYNSYWDHRFMIYVEGAQDTRLEAIVARFMPSHANVIFIYT